MYFRLTIAAAAATLMLSACSTQSDDLSAASSPAEPVEAAGYQAPREFSGIAWLQTRPATDRDQEVFLVAHDVRADEKEGQLPRLSLVATPLDETGIQINPVTAEFPETANDLESIARLPGRDAALLVESNADGKDPTPSIYLATWDDDLKMQIDAQVPWPKTPEPLVNVEASAVFSANDQDWFLYAERAEDLGKTQIHMTKLKVGSDQSVTFGSQWQSVSFTPPVPQGARPATAMDISTNGNVYVAAAVDPGDVGPFDSAVYRAAKLSTQDNTVKLAGVRSPKPIGRSNGLKIEALALIDGKQPLFFGDDDEDYGGLLRQLRTSSSQ